MSVIVHVMEYIGLISNVGSMYVMIVGLGMLGLGLSKIDER
jgi:hypothetical protein